VINSFEEKRRNGMRTALAFLLLLVSASESVAQRSPAQRDYASPEIAGRLRAFYFNLAHNDWEALTADILAAKVVAHRPPPEYFVVDAARRGDSAQAGETNLSCTEAMQAAVEEAVIELDGDWAEVSVPRCNPAIGADEFRLIRFDGRWRFVYIQLFRRPINVTTER
jgi:hypothetical protein